MTSSFGEGHGIFEEAMPKKYIADDCVAIDNRQKQRNVAFVRTFNTEIHRNKDVRPLLKRRGHFILLYVTKGKQKAVIEETVAEKF